ncbi:MAP kinase-activating death domain protein-like isoform X3 [Varroa destructor]|uniref:MAP kinase-activating death domain protein n=1 Tax=Varroa destructor TaxID=109461 RepID=A0A7M7KC77_VARDE|nr:MAP kinase-activating death domain protein-like isoform X3 [Varroa destructor]
MDIVGKYFCPRLVDYLVVVGASSNHHKKVQLPKLLRRYPITDHQDFALPHDVCYFCQPEGCQLRGAKQLGARDFEPFVFSLTEKDSSRVRYGVCVNLQRRLSHAPAPSGSVCGASGAPALTHRAPQFSLTSFCVISHHPFFSTFRECLVELKKILDTFSEAGVKCTCQQLCNKDPLWEVFVSPDVATATLCPALLEVIQEIEKWILRLLSLPVPVPERTKIEVELLSLTRREQPVVFALPDHKRFSLLDFPVHLPLELLGVDNCIEVLKCILLENKVVIQSHNYNALSISIMSLVALLYPLEYMFPVIPLLPTIIDAAEQLLLAPTPYIIGVPASFFASKSKQLLLPNDVWLVDLDTCTITRPSGCEPIPPLPYPEGALLSEYFSQLLGSMKVQSSSPVVLDADTVDVAIRVSLVKFFNSPGVLQNVLEHTRTLRLYPRPVVAFQVNSFLMSRARDGEPPPFLRKLVRTQAVEYFIEWALKPSNVAFERINTGISDAMTIGDKPKWYSDELEAIQVAVWSEKLEALLRDIQERSRKQDAESGCESEPFSSDDDEDAVELNGEQTQQPMFVRTDSMAEKQIEERQNPTGAFPVFFDHSLIYQPPTQLVVPGTPSSQHTARERRDSFSDSSLSDNNNEDQQTQQINNNQKIGTQQAAVQKNNKSDDAARVGSGLERGKIRAKQRPVGRRGRGGDRSTQASGEQHGSSSSYDEDSDDGVRSDESGDENEFSQDMEQAAEKIAKKLSGVLYRAGSLGQNAQSKNAHLIEKMIKAKEGFGKANRAAEEFAKTAASASKKKFAQALSGDRMAEAKGILNESGLDRVADQTKEIADQTKSVISGLIGKTKEKSEPLGPMAKAQFSKFSHHHQGGDRRSSGGNRASRSSLEASEQQKFLLEVVTGVAEGKGLKFLQQGRIKQLMASEGHRNFVLSKLNKAFEHKVGPDDYIEDVLEIAHTHYHDTLGGSRSSRGSLSHNILGSTSNQSLSQLSAQSAISTDTIYPSATGQGGQETLGRSSGRPSLDLGGMGRGLFSRGGNVLFRVDAISDSSTSEMFKSGLSSMRRMMNKISNNNQSDVSETGSISTNPMFLQRKERKGSAARSAISDGDADLMSLGGFRKESFWCAGRPVTAGTRALPRVSSVEQPERVYVYQELLKERSSLWDHMEFWEDVFYDAVTQERDLIGMDQKPGEMMERYTGLNNSDQKRLQEDEDRLLAVVLQNLIAFMLMMSVNKDRIRQKIRRLLGKCHISLAYSAEVNDVLGQLDSLDGNDLNLKPLASQQVLRQTFTVRFGSDAAETTRFMEVREDGLIVRAANGSIVERYFFERIVNITYCPTNNVLCLWRQSGAEMQLHKYYTSKCKKLYYCIKSAMDNAISRDGLHKPLPDLGGEFPIEDMQTGEGGILQVYVDGVGLLFENTKFFVRVENIYKCYHTIEGEFVLEEYNPKTKKIAERKYRSKMAYNIFYAVLCVFSYLAAGPAKTPSPNAPDTNTNIQHQSAPTPPGGAPGIGSSGDQNLKPTRPGDADSSRRRGWIKAKSSMLIGVLTVTSDNTGVSPNDTQAK